MSEADFKNYFYLVCVVLFLIKRFVIDKKIYNLSPDEDYPIAEKSLKSVYLPIKWWRRYYSATWAAFILSIPLSFMWLFILILGELNLVAKVALFLVCLALFYLPLFIRKKHIECIKFKSFPLNTDIENAYQIIEKRQKKEGWKIVSKEDNKYIQFHIFGFLKTDQLVTVALIDNKVLINSIASPYTQIRASISSDHNKNIEFVRKLLVNEN